MKGLAVFMAFVLMLGVGTGAFAQAEAEFTRGGSFSLDDVPSEAKVGALVGGWATAAALATGGFARSMPAWTGGGTWAYGLVVGPTLQYLTAPEAVGKLRYDPRMMVEGENRKWCKIKGHPNWKGLCQYEVTQAYWAGQKPGPKQNFTHR